MGAFAPGYAGARSDSLRFAATTLANVPRASLFGNRPICLYDSMLRTRLRISPDWRLLRVERGTVTEKTRTLFDVA
jgi:hypothetical protein